MSDTDKLGVLIREAVEHANSLSSVASSDPWCRIAAEYLQRHSVIRLSVSAEAVERAARSLWRMGNARIGNRPWEVVSAYYIGEATAALKAASVGQDGDLV